jgi:hypothetical protein
MLSFKLHGTTSISNSLVTCAQEAVKRAALLRVIRSPYIVAAGYPLPMDYLPSEIAARIFRFASTDGGRTASSLRLVSRSVYAVANLHRFHTVAVSGVAAILQLSHELSECAPELRIIEHIFISDKPRGRATDKFSRPPNAAANPLSDGLNNKIRAQIWEANRKEAVQLEPLLRMLLQYASPHARSVTLMFFNPCHPNPAQLFHSLSLQNISHLAFRYPEWLEEHDWSTCVLEMPALESLVLNIAMTDSVDSLLNMVEHVTEQCPTVQRITLHGIIPTLHFVQFVIDIASEREGLEAASWALVDYDIHTVHPRALYMDQASQASLKRLVKAVEDEQIEGVHVRPMVDHAPSYADWLDMWHRMVAARTV